MWLSAIEKVAEFAILRSDRSSFRVAFEAVDCLFEPIVTDFTERTHPISTKGPI